MVKFLRKKSNGADTEYTAHEISYAYELHEFGSQHICIWKLIYGNFTTYMYTCFKDIVAGHKD